MLGTRCPLPRCGFVLESSIQVRLRTGRNEARIAELRVCSRLFGYRSLTSATAASICNDLQFLSHVIQLRELDKFNAMTEILFDHTDEQESGRFDEDLLVMEYLDVSKMGRSTNSSHGRRRS